MILKKKRSICPAFPLSFYDLSVISSYSAHFFAFLLKKPLFFFSFAPSLSSSSSSSSEYTKLIAISPAPQRSMIQKCSVRSSPVTGDILSPRTPDGASFVPSTLDTKPPSLSLRTPLRYLPSEPVTDVPVPNTALLVLDEVVVLLVLEVVRELDELVVLELDDELEELVVVLELDDELEELEVLSLSIR